jgi:hypothetical protein
VQSHGKRNGNHQAPAKPLITSKPRRVKRARPQPERAGRDGVTQRSTATWHPHLIGGAFPLGTMTPKAMWVMSAWDKRSITWMTRSW